MPNDDKTDKTDGKRYDVALQLTTTNSEGKIENQTTHGWNGLDAAGRIAVEGVIRRELNQAGNKLEALGLANAIAKGRMDQDTAAGVAATLNIEPPSSKK